MMGTTAFMVDDQMVCAVTERGILFRITADRRDEWSKLPGTEPAMMKDRPMAGFLLVRDDGLPNARMLSAWIRRGLESAKRRGQEIARTKPPRKGAVGSTPGRRAKPAARRVSAPRAVRATTLPSHAPATIRSSTKRAGAKAKRGARKVSGARAGDGEALETRSRSLTSKSAARARPTGKKRPGNRR